MQALADIAHQLGNGTLELTSRGNVQIRGVSDGLSVSERLAACGLLPSETHDHVRNIVASALSGRLGGLVDIRGLVTDLDCALQAEPAFAELSGRIMFGCDDGRGDVAALGPDFGVHSVGDDLFALILAGRDTGVRIELAAVVDLIVRSAHVFLHNRGTAWRLAEVPDGLARTVAELGAEITHEPVEFTNQLPPIGWFTQADGLVSLGAGIRFGTFDAELAEFLAAPNCPVTITPWRTLMLHDLDESVADTVLRVLAPRGLIFDAQSPWLDVTACTGLPACARSVADVRSDAMAAVSRSELPISGKQHWSGCERRCGRPADAADVLATPSGYQVRA